MTNFRFSSILHLLHVFHPHTKAPDVFNNRVERSVEFVLAPQHDTSCDSEITTKEDFDYWRKLIEESNLEVYRRSHDGPNEAEGWTTTKDTNSLEHCHVYLFDVLWICTLHIYCESPLGNGNGLLFHMTQPISRSTIKAIACSKPTISEH